ncbi:MAG TPA: hypothetical protein VIT64_12940 [Ilumatobacteraceae bacterium]
MVESAPGRPRRSVRPGSLGPLGPLGPLAELGTDAVVDPAVVQEVVRICGRTDRAHALPVVRALVQRLDRPGDAGLDDVTLDLGRRARRLVVAVWAAGGEAVFLDGAARLVPGVPAPLGPEIGKVLRRRKPQELSAWAAAAGAARSTSEDVVLALGALVESLVDDLALALRVERATVEAATWPTQTWPVQ